MPFTDYSKLDDEYFIKLSGATPVDSKILDRFERLTGREPHAFLRRHLAFAHRDLDMILDRYERNEKFFLWTGRGPSSDSMHVGHSVPFQLARYVSTCCAENTQACL